MWRTLTDLSLRPIRQTLETKFSDEPIRIIIIGYLKQFVGEKSNLLPAPFEVDGAPPKMVFTTSGSPIDLALLFSSFALPMGNGGATSFFDGRVLTDARREFFFIYFVWSRGIRQTNWFFVLALPSVANNTCSRMFLSPTLIRLKKHERESRFMWNWPLNTSRNPSPDVDEPKLEIWGNIINLKWLVVF